MCNGAQKVPGMLSLSEQSKRKTDTECDFEEVKSNLKREQMI